MGAGIDPDARTWIAVLHVRRHGDGEEIEHEDHGALAVRAERCPNIRIIAAHHGDRCPNRATGGRAWRFAYAG